MKRIVRMLASLFAAGVLIVSVSQSAQACCDDGQCCSHQCCKKDCCKK
ncbi:MAG: hypothetical protein ACKV22_02300 [Bryobacteraceae bacterium]